MIDQSLFDYFVMHHLPRAEVLNRLPFSVIIDDFWPQLLQLRKTRAVQIPLTGLDGQTIWFVMSDSLMASGDRVSSMARRDIDQLEPGEDIMTEGLMDEAFFTSLVEGAPVSRLESRRFLKSGEDPVSVGELLAQNNLSAIRYMTDHRYDPFSGNMLLTFALLLTNAMDVETEDYRQSDKHLIPGRDSVSVQVPSASDIPQMMDSLCSFLNAYEMHPLLKAAIAHAYILLVRPYEEGNERLARLISYSVLLRSGYSFFRQFALSGMIAQDGVLYYKAMQTLQEGRSGGDMTYFLEYYLGMLSRSVTGFDAYIAQKRRAEEEKKQAMPGTASYGQYTKTEDLYTDKRRAKPVSSQQEVKREDSGNNNSVDERTMLLAKCTSPEMLVSLVIKQQADSLVINDIKPYLDKLGVTKDTILRTLRDFNTDISQRVLAMYSLLQATPSRKYTCTEMAELLQITKGTARRTCYLMTSLNLIQAVQSTSKGSRRQLLCFYYSDTMAA